jgi:cytochrome c553
MVLPCHLLVAPGGPNLNQTRQAATSSLQRWTGVPVASLLALVLVVGLGAALLGFYRLNRTYDNPPTQLAVTPGPENVERAERYVELCATCHAEDKELPMAGADFMGDGAPPIGTFYAPNLTPVHLEDWSDGEIIRAIREGVHKSGRSLLIMPSRVFRNLSDGDVQALVDVLRAQPPVEPDTPPTRFNLLGAILSNMGFQVAQEPVTEPVVAPPRAPTVEYGRYLTSVMCIFCHGEELEGGQTYRAPGLALAGSTWTSEQFSRFIRTGTKPNGVISDSTRMPWPDVSKAFPEDVELEAMHAYMGALTPE